MVLIIRLQGTLRKYNRIYINYFFSNYISHYSATQTSDAAYIIGGFSNNIPSVIAEFKNDEWRRLDDLNTGRYWHGSITLGKQTMIIGGYTNSE